MGFTFKTAMAAALLCALAFAPPSRASCLPIYQLDVTLDPQAGTLEGRMTVDLDCDGAPPSSIVLWLYPNRLARPPAMLDAMNTYWIYPYHFDPGSMEIRDVEVGGQGVQAWPVELPQDHALAGMPDMAVSIPLDGTSTRVALDYSVRIPKRYGLFGRARGGVLLASGWHPVVGSPDDLEAPPAPGRYRVSLELPTEHDVVLGKRVVRGREVQVETGPTSQLPLAAYPELHSTGATCLGVRVNWHGLTPRPQDASRAPGQGEVLGLPDSLPDIMAYDRPLMAMEVACRTVEILQQMGGHVPQGASVDLLEAPLRLQVASPTPAAAIVSDRAFDILPARRAWKFHEFQVARAVAASLVMRGARDALEADFVAAAVVERYTATWHGVSEDARDVLRYGSFLASIDYFLYSPLVQFRESYFFTVAEKDWLRDEPWAFLNRLPRGKLYHDKLVDILGKDEVAALATSFLEGQGSLEDLAGEDLSWFWEQWSSAYPSLNYRVDSVSTAKLGPQRFAHAARIERQGDTWIREPVRVRFELADGTHLDAVWFEAGAEGSVAVETDVELERVVVDPEMRLFEDASLTTNHPRFDNASRPTWRPPVFAAFGLTSNITELTGDIDILFDMRRRFDVVDGFRMRLVLATWGQGGTAWYSHGFGKKRDLNNASWHVGTFLSGFHHDPRWGYRDGDTWQGGTSITAGVYLDHDSRFYLFNPTDGWNMGLSASYSLGVDDGKWSRPGDIRHVLSVGTRAFYLWTPVGGHTFAIYGGASGNFGRPYIGQLETLSSFEKLRGFDADETFGRVVLYACLEYRHLFTQAMNVNLAHLVTWQGIQGVLFAGAGTSSDGNSYRGLFATDRIFTEVGYGLRGILAYFGAYPGIIALDLAVPITPRTRKHPDGTSRLPVSLRIAFNHVF